MKRLFIQLSTVVILLTVFSLHCQGQYTMEYNLEKGKTYKQRLVTDMNMTMDAMGQIVKVNVKSEMGFHYDVVGQNNGVYDIQLSYQKFKMEMGAPAPFAIDSDAPENSTDASLGNAFKSIMGLPIDVQLTKQGKVTSVKGMDKLTEKLNAVDNAQFKQMLGQQFSEKTIQTLLEQSSSYFPGKPVAVGDNWEVVTSISNQGVDIISKMNLTLKQVANNIATLELTGTLATPEGGVVTNVQGMDAKISINGKQAGNIQLDLKTGWVVRSEVTQNLKQNIEVMGQTMPQDVETKVTITAE